MAMSVKKITVRRDKPLRQFRAKAQRNSLAAGESRLGRGPIEDYLVKGAIAVDRVGKSFGLSKAQIAETTGISLETFYRPDRVTSPKTQARLKEMLEIVGRVQSWAGGKDQAMAWYRAEPIAAFGGRTAEALVKDGKATALRGYLDHVALGGFA
jgi:hypothetical protein